MNRSSTPKPWRHRLRHSLKWRLVALFLLLALAMSAAFLHGMQRAMALGWRDAVKPLLSDYVDRLAADIGTPPDPARAQALTARLPISVRIEGPLVTLDTHPKAQHERWQRGRLQADDVSRFGDADGDSARLLQRQTTDGHTVSFGLGDLNWRRGPGIAGWITLSSLLALTAIAYLYVRRLLKPLDDIGAGAKRFGDGNFATPIPQRRRDELGELAGQINTMGQSIHQMLEAKRGLLLAISHELRSPLTRARVHTELLPESPDTQSQRDALLRDLADMARLITDLLESERLASPHAALKLEPCDPGALVQTVLASFSPGQGAQLNIQLDIQSPMPLCAMDPVRMRLALRNLIDNALRHNPSAGKPVEVRVWCDAGDVFVSVRDHGHGVDESKIKQLAEPFYRPDDSRQRSTGGVGLGLYLSKLVAQAHGGTLTIGNASPGLEVRLSVSARLGAGSARG